MLYTQRLIDWLIMSGLFVAMEAEKPTAAEKKRTTHHLGVMEKIRSLRQCADYALAGEKGYSQAHNYTCTVQ